MLFNTFPTLDRYWPYTEDLQEVFILFTLKYVLALRKGPSIGPISLDRAGTAFIVRYTPGTGPVMSCLLGKPGTNQPP